MNRKDLAEKYGVDKVSMVALLMNGSPTYEWQRKLDGMTFLESEIERYSYKMLKELIE